MGAVLLKAATAMLEAGLCPVPAAADGTKRPMPGGSAVWKPYTHRLPTPGELGMWFANGSTDGIGTVCGAVAGNLLGFDIEGRAVTEGVWQEVQDIAHRTGLADLLNRCIAGYAETTASNGAHILVRCDRPVSGNLKLARRPATPEELAADPDDRVKVLLETRGEGGYLVLAPSGGRTHPNGREWRVVTGGVDTIAMVTADELEDLYALFRSVDRMPAAAPPPPRQSRPVGDGARPGDRYSDATSWADLLTPHGWVHVYSGSRDVHRYEAWRRPGKTAGISATTNANGTDTLIVHSTSTPFDAHPSSYTKFGAFAVLQHNGDHAAAARALAADPRYGGTPKAERTPPPPPPAEENFWAARPELTHIHTAAQAALASPWASLVAALCRITAATEPNVVLPPILGRGPMSLNLFGAIAGPSGDGKGIALSVAADAIRIPIPIAVASPGSGEGVAHAYLRRVPCPKEDGGGTRLQHHETRVLFVAHEVDTLTAVQSRQASTLMPELRKAYVGEPLGFQYVDPLKRLPLAAHAYRLCLLVGVQPRKAGPILNDADGGTPRRFLWAETSDTTAPDLAPPAPLSRTWQHPQVIAGPNGRCEIPVCDRARTEIRAKQLAKLRREAADPLDGHLLLTRLKAAAALALLNGRLEVRDDDWVLAGAVIEHSNKVRGQVVKELSEQHAEANRSRAHDEAERAVVVDDRTERHQVQRVTKRVIDRLRQHGGWMAGTELRRATAHRDRQWLDQALEHAVGAGQIEAENTPGQGTPGRRFRGAA